MNSYQNRDGLDKSNQGKAVNNKVFVNDYRNLPSTYGSDYHLYTEKLLTQKNFNGKDPYVKQPTINFRAQQNFPQRTVMINQVIATKKVS